MNSGKARSFFQSVLADTLSGAIEQVSTVVELGCGIGANIWMLSRRFPGKTYLGADYSSNAVRCAEYLFGKANPGVQVTQFDFYQARYDVLEKLNENERIVLFTCHALEQIPAAAKIVETLSQYRKKIHAIFHFEPVYELYDNLLQGLMRKRYTEINDYNRDLFSVLNSRADIRIRHSEAEFSASILSIPLPSYDGNSMKRLQRTGRNLLYRSDALVSAPDFSQFMDSRIWFWRRRNSDPPTSYNHSIDFPCSFVPCFTA